MTQPPVHPLVAAVLAVTPTWDGLGFTGLMPAGRPERPSPTWGDPEPVAARQAAAVLRWLADHIDATWVQLGPLRQRHVIDVDQLRGLAAVLDPDDPPPPDATEDLDPDELEAGRG